MTYALARDSTAPAVGQFANRGPGEAQLASARADFDRGLSNHADLNGWSRPNELHDRLAPPDGLARCSDVLPFGREEASEGLCVALVPGRDKELSELFEVAQRSVGPDNVVVLGRHSDGATTTRSVQHRDQLGAVPAGEGRHLGLLGRDLPPENTGLFGGPLFPRDDLAGREAT